jgi:hypothetical protein
MNFFVAGPASAKDPNGRNPRRLPCSFRQGTMNDPAGKREVCRARPMALYSASLLAFRWSGATYAMPREFRGSFPDKASGKTSERDEKYNRKWNLRGNPNEPAKPTAFPYPCSTEFPGLTESNDKLGKVGMSPIEAIQIPEDVAKRPNLTAGNPEKPRRVRPVPGRSLCLETRIARASNCRRAISESATPNGRERGGLTTKKIEGRKYLQYFQAVGVDGIPSMLSIPYDDISIFAFSI